MICYYVALLFKIHLYGVFPGVAYEMRFTWHSLVKVYRFRIFTLLTNSRELRFWTIFPRCFCNKFSDCVSMFSVCNPVCVCGSYFYCVSFTAWWLRVQYKVFSPAVVCESSNRNCFHVGKFTTRVTNNDNSPPVIKVVILENNGCCKAFQEPFGQQSTKFRKP